LTRHWSTRKPPQRGEQINNLAPLLLVLLEEPLKKIVIGEWLLVNGEAVPFGQILNSFGEATTHHSTNLSLFYWKNHFNQVF